MEAARHVAARAVLAEFAAMDIIALVAIDALAAQLRRIARAAMAGRTDQAPMPAGQRESGRRVMVETPGLPADRIVA